MTNEFRRELFRTWLLILAAIMLAIVVNVLALSRHARAASLECLPASIRAALATVEAACGPVTVISTLRRGARIAGTRHPSMHATCRAADFGLRRYDCAIAALAGWPHRLSIDPRRVQHLHIDDGGPRLRFRHGGHGHRRARR